MTMANKVIILGGGVAGMSAAQELMERGFQVTVYEKRGIPGGKARSVPVPNSAMPGNRDLPGEHGFRFFPSFYRHVTDTMKRIPYGTNKQGVFDNLVAAPRAELTQYGKQGALFITHFPRSRSDLKFMLKNSLDFESFGLKLSDIEFFGGKLWEYLTSCEARRLDTLEKIGWWSYLDAANQSLAYQKFLATGLTRSLVAAKATVANTRVEGHVGTMLMMGMSEPGVNTDRLLDGPTNDVWIGPWLAYLQSKDVNYCLETSIDTIHYDDKKKRISGVTLRRQSDGTTFDDSADYYILAVPVEQAARLFEQEKHAEILDADPTLKGVIELRDHVAWMNGVQFYLKKDIQMVHGHMIHIDSNWSLTSISQAQFWKEFPWPTVGQGNVKGILSVDISNWDQAGDKVRKKARECTRAEIKEEVLHELMKSVNLPGQPDVLQEEDVVGFFLDPDIKDDQIVDPAQLRFYEDAEPLYIDEPDSWHMRPDAYTRISNFFLAADYVRTNTMLATMEGANEAARRAVNSILSASQSSAPLCRIWSMRDPIMFAIWRWHDSQRYKRGEPWKTDFPWFIDAAQWLLAYISHIWYIVTGRRRKPI
jgi:15-cis-phytoene desaturase